MTSKLRFVIFSITLLTGLLAFVSCGSEINTPTATPSSAASDSTSDVSPTRNDEIRPAIPTAAPAKYQPDQKAKASEAAVYIPVAPAVVAPEPALAVTDGVDIPDSGATRSTDPEAQTTEPKLEGESPAAIVPDDSTPMVAAPTPTPQILVVQPTPTPIQVTEKLASSLPIGGQVGNQAPEFQSINNWINSDPLTMQVLRGQVVLIDFVLHLH